MKKIIFSLSIIMFIGIASNAQDPAYDDFERTTGLGSNWTVYAGGSSVGIVNGSDIGLLSAPSLIGILGWGTNTFSADQYSEAQISFNTIDSVLKQVFVRRRASDFARYAFHWNNANGGRYELKYDGVPTPQVRVLTSVHAPPPLPGDTLRIEIQGMTMKGYVNGVLLLTATDTAFTTSNPITATGVPGVTYRFTVGYTATYPTSVFEWWKGGSSSSQATWSSAISLGSGIFYSLEAKDSTVHIAYGDGTITYRRSINEGTTWSSPITLGSGTLYLDRPICVDGSNVFVVYFRNFNTVTDWCCPRNLGNIFMRKSTDGGVTWQPEIQLTTAQGGYRVAINASGANVYLTWMDYRSGTTWDLYFRKSVDSGITWQPEVKLVAGNNSVGAERPDIVVLGSSVHLFWMSAFDNLPPCYTMPNCSEVFYKRSLDGGTTWGPDTRLNFTNNYAARPISTVIPPSTVITSWEGEDGTGENEPYTLRSTDNGTTWETVQRMRFLPGEASHQNVASGGSNVHLAWHDQRNPTNKEIYYRPSSNEGATWGIEELVSNAPGESLVPILGTTANYVHALWGDDRGGSFAPWYSRRMVSTGACPASITANGSTTFCSYDDVILNANTGIGLTYQWKLNGVNIVGATSSSYSASISGSYAVEVTNASTCSALSNAIVVNVNACGFTINLKVFLEGYYAGGDTLRAVVDPINYPLLCDTVTVELYNSSSPYILASSATNAIDIYGYGQFVFAPAFYNSGYYIVIRQRNSIETWSKMPVNIGANTNFDFTQ